MKRRWPHQSSSNYRRESAVRQSVTIMVRFLLKTAKSDMKPCQDTRQVKLDAFVLFRKRPDCAFPVQIRIDCLLCPSHASDAKSSTLEAIIGIPAGLIRPIATSRNENFRVKTKFVEMSAVTRKKKFFTPGRETVLETLPGHCQVKLYCFCAFLKGPRIFLFPVQISIVWFTRLFSPTQNHRH